MRKRERKTERERGREKERVEENKSGARESVLSFFPILFFQQKKESEREREGEK